ncbi:unnamed protein product [Prorocentrum cordatum]|uniref:Hexosyltransferase n=1 Tax=Prorocentrum cordatum TaxID=2364126 RepID=A0ABN9T1C1_9DINO|nr:unnamed protein product [Polarella glacialis]
MLPARAGAGSAGGRQRLCGARGAALAAAGGLLAVWALAQGRGGDPRAAMRARRSSAISSLAKAECAESGADCTSLKCCKEAGMQCYQKNPGWAECRADCTEGLDLRGPDNSSWSCKELGDRTAGDVPPPCVGAFEDCAASRCCNVTGFACYEKSKSDGSAFCKAECTPGPDPTDADSTPWTCKKLGAETAGPADWVKKQCAQSGTNCIEVGCCADEGKQCYAKDSGWGQCKYGCVDPAEPWKGLEWSCEEIGPRTPQGKPAPWENQRATAPWVEAECAGPGEDCSKHQCCKEEGQQCYTKNEEWSACRPQCEEGPDLWDNNYEPWSCSSLGSRTPGFARGHTGADPVSDWVATKCANQTKDCRKQRCCADPGHACYEKNEEWATCMKSCDPGKHEYDADNLPWTCNQIGPRTPVLWGSPSLFCYSVITINDYSSEPELVKGQIERGSGIFECDEYAVYSTAEPTVVGIGPSGKVTTIQFEPAEITTSKDGTSGNAELFMHVWDAVKADNRWSTTDWTVKVDPDAVLIPFRLRQHLRDHTGQTAYIVNCNKPLLPEGPMMFGALEAFSQSALGVYFAREQECIGGMYWKDWGEDWFMGHCLDFLGVEQVHDYEIYSDGVCTGVDCSNPVAAAFHPKKDIGSWSACYEEALAAGNTKQDAEAAATGGGEGEGGEGEGGEGGV